MIRLGHARGSLGSPGGPGRGQPGVDRVPGEPGGDHPLQKRLRREPRRYILLADNWSVPGFQLGKVGLIFRSHDDPDDWHAAVHYLSGDVRERLRQVRPLADRDPRYAANVAALEAVQPEWLPGEAISARLGAVWIRSASRDTTSLARPAGIGFRCAADASEP